MYLPSYRVCSNHFSPEQYLKNGLLKKESVPLCDHQQLEQSSCNILPQPHYTIKKEFISPTSRYFLINILSNCYFAMHNNFYRACHEPLISEHNYCTTMPNSVSTSLTKRRKIFNAVTIGDLEKYHFSTLSKARSHLKMVKDKYKEKQIQNQNLKQQNKRLRAKLPKYEQLITSLQS